MSAGPSGYVDLNWVATLAYHADRSPRRPVMRFGEDELTYGQLYERVQGLAAGLRATGIDQGDVVALLADNSPEFLEVMLAVNYLGATVTPINTRLAPDEVSYILDHSRSKTLVVDDGSKELAAQALKTAAPVPCVAMTESSQEWPTLESLRARPEGPHRVMAGPELHRLMYTSGTTSRPKGVMISHGNLLWKNLSQAVVLGLTSADIGLVCGPLYHVGALDLTATTLLYVGGSLVVHRRFQAATVIEEIARGAVTTVWLAPAMLNAILAHPDADARDLTGLRLIIGGGEKMPEHLIHRLQAVFPNAWFADAYGLTETVSGDTFLEAESTLSRRGSVGKPVPYLEVAIWDPATNQPVAPRTSGEVVLRGPKVFQGYWRDPEATVQAFRGGWFHTGDIGYLDDGYLYIVDRLKDVIISGGENVASSEVERVIYGFPGVHECAVVAQPDPRWGEVPIAYVVMSEGVEATEAAIVEHCGRSLAKFKVPKAVTFLSALPRTASGKVLKRELRESAGRAR